MGVGRLRGAVSDAAETLLRLFRDVPIHQLPAALPHPVTHGAPPLAVVPVALAHGFDPRMTSPGWHLAVPVREEPTAWMARLVREDAWDRWAAGAAVMVLEVFHPAGRRQVSIPSLPREPKVLRLEPGGFRVALRQHRQPLTKPGALRASPALPLPAVRRDLDRALGLPVAVATEDLQRVPKALWMRYTLALVKATGENIRALEVLGLFRVPSRGVASLRHEARTGRLMLELTREASGAPRVPLILARRREDHAILTCFPEEGP